MCSCIISRTFCVPNFAAAQSKYFWFEAVSLSLIHSEQKFKFFWMFLHICLRYNWKFSEWVNGKALIGTWWYAVDDSVSCQSTTIPFVSCCFLPISKLIPYKRGLTRMRVIVQNRAGIFDLIWYLFVTPYSKNINYGRTGNAPFWRVLRQLQTLDQMIIWRLGYTSVLAEAR